MSQYRAQFVSMICCRFLYVEDYISDMVIHMKSRIRRLTEDAFVLQLKIRDSLGKAQTLNTDEAEGFCCPKELIGQKCTEIPVEVFCTAGCASGLLKEAMHQAILESSRMQNMALFFLLEEAWDE